jgi:NADP-dependent 3-hydroxy acid dehydrogenase YdfG
MPVIAIIGAGPGLGRAIAKTFGDQGHTVALLSRTPAKLEPVVAELGDQGVQAAAFAADVLDRSSITSGLTAVKQRFGPVDVLEYSPANAQLPTAPATELTHDNVQIQLDFYAHGAVAAVNQVLPDMLERGSARSCSPPAPPPSIRSSVTRCSPTSPRRRRGCATGRTVCTPP